LLVVFNIIFNLNCAYLLKKRHKMPRRVTLDGEEQARRRETQTTTPRRQNTKTTTPIIHKPTPATPIPNVSSPPDSHIDWKREYLILKEAHRRQGQRLEALQSENEALLQTLLRDTAKPFPSTSTPIAKDKTKPHIYSPGTQFVAELVEVMELDVGHHALLSSIIDRQHEEQQRRRRRCSM
jgi:hypothetical protein